MAASKASTVEEYLADLSGERRDVLSAVRKVIRQRLPKGYRERMNFGMIAYEIPLERYPETYNKQPLLYAALAAQKNYYAVYLQGVYANPAVEAWFREAYRGAGKKLDMGKSCVRFRALDEVPLNVIGECIARVPVDAFIAQYESVRGKRARPATKPAKAKPKAAAKRSARATKAKTDAPARRT